MSRALTRVGIKLAVLPDYASRARAALLALTVGLVVVLGLAAVTVPFVVDRQQERIDSRSMLAASDPARASLLAYDTGSFPERNLWNGHHITRLYVAATKPGTPAPPGAPRLPAPGTALVSPALGDLLASDPVVAALFESFKIEGILDSGGLTSPTELRAVLGVSSSFGGRLAGVAGFGPDGADHVSDDGPVSIIVTAFLLLLIGLPAGALVVLSARLAAERRIDRATCLRILGLSAGQVRRVMVTETALIAIPAALLGVGAYLLLRRTVNHVPGTTLGFYAADTELPVPLLVAVPVIVVASAVCAGAWFVKDRGGTVRPRALRRRPRAWTLVVGTAAVACFLLLARFREIVPWLAPGLVLVVAVAGAVMGALVAGPKVVTVVANYAAGRASRGGSLVGLRSLQAASGSTTRLTAVMSIAIVVIGAALPFLAILDGGDKTRAQEVLAASDGVTLVIDRSDPPVSPRQLRSWPEVRSALPIVSARGAVRHEEVLAVVGDCSDIQRMTTTPVQGCKGSVQWLSSSGLTLSSQEMPRSSTLELPNEVRIEVPSPDDVVTAVGLPDTLIGYLLVPPRLIHAGEVETHPASLLNVVPSETKVVMARLDGQSPGIAIRAGEFGYLDPDQSEYRGQIQALLLGFTVCVSIGILAIAMSAVGEASSRRSRVVGLMRLGAGRAEVVRAHAFACGFPIAVLGLLASALAASFFGIMRATDDRADVPIVIYLALGLGSVLVAVLVAALSLPPILGPIRPKELSDRV